MSGSEKTTRKDWLLLAIEAAGQKGLDSAQLQKVLYVFGRESPATVTEKWYDFIPYDYGPFTSAIYRDAEELAAGGLLEIRPGDVKQYVRGAGATDAAQITAGTDRAAAGYLATLVKWAQGLTWHQLLRAIYKKYPEMRSKSVYRDA